MKRLIVGVFVSSILTVPLSADAHPFDLGRLLVKVDATQMHVTLELNKAAVVQITGLSLDSLAEEVVESEKDLVFAATLGEAQVVLSNQTNCRWLPQTAIHTVKETVHLEAVVSCPSPIDEWSLSLPFLKRAPSTFELLTMVNQNSRSTESVASISRPDVRYENKREVYWLQFIKMGIEHIGITPNQWTDGSRWHLPEGIDHILFVVALVLGGGGLIELLKTVTGFTIGHSLTLALSTLGWLHVSSRVVESGIALSIAVLAAESLIAKKALLKSRWKVALAFGLLHGLGFATALTELQLQGEGLIKAILGFNLGVEFAQGFIVMITLPLLYLARKNTGLREQGLPLLAMGILAIGAFWFVRRAFSI